MRPEGQTEATSPPSTVEHSETLKDLVVKGRISVERGVFFSSVQSELLK